MKEVFHETTIIGSYLLNQPLGRLLYEEDHYNTILYRQLCDQLPDHHLCIFLFLKKQYAIFFVSTKEIPGICN